MRAPAILRTLSVLAVLHSPSSAVAHRWDIRADGSGDAPTIQAGIDLAANGDSVVLAPGTYKGVGNRDITYNGKSLLVTSSGGRDVTIIDCESAGRGFVFNSMEPSAARLEEITITRGSADQGGGIYIWHSHPTIHRCAVSFCNAIFGGGGIYCGESGGLGGPVPLISIVEDNLITSNSADTGGGFSDALYAEVQFQFNTVQGNTARLEGGGIYSANEIGYTLLEGNTVEGNGAGLGGGISLLLESRVTDNRVMGNHATRGAGIYLSGAPTIEGNLIAGNQGEGVYIKGDATLQNCTIVSNSTYGVLVDRTIAHLKRCIIAFNGGRGVACENPVSTHPKVECCDLFYNGGGSCMDSAQNLIEADPLFCETAGDNAYHVASNSPCAPSLSPCGQLIGAFGVACGPVAPKTYVTCPPDTIVAQGVSYTLITLGRFTIANGGALPASFGYQLTSVGPGFLIDGGNPLSLAGATPQLEPGESYQPPSAWLLAPSMGYFEQPVSCHVTNLSLQIDAICSTTVKFAPPVPVAFAQLSARLDGRSVHLSWLFHSGAEPGEIGVRRVIGSQPVIVARLPINTREYVDRAAEPGHSNVYDLVLIQNDGVVSTSSRVQVDVPAFSLAFRSVSPNPFRTSTLVAFEIPEAGRVTLEVFDVAGRRIRTLIDTTLEAGARDVPWETSDEALATGVYFLRLSQGHTQITRKVTILK